MLQVLGERSQKRTSGPRERAEARRLHPPVSYRSSAPRRRRLVNNAGIIAYEPLDELSLQTWQEMIAVDQTGVFLGMREAVRVRRQKSSSIINISSIWGNSAVAGAHAYHAAKGAVRNMSKNAAISSSPPTNRAMLPARSW